MISSDKSPSAACKDFERDLVLFYYGESVEKERGRVEIHLQSCAGCRQFLANLQSLLPMTIKPDEPPPAFWQSYSSEMRRKLAAVEQKPSWRGALVSYFRPWQVPALATALVLVLALTLTFGKRMWRSPELPPEEEAILEILPLAENFDFFTAMELLDSLDILEGAGGLENGSA